MVSCPVRDSGGAVFPGLTLLQLLPGFRLLADLQYAFLNCWARGDVTSALLNTLFSAGHPMSGMCRNRQAFFLILWNRCGRGHR